MPKVDRCAKPARGRQAVFPIVDQVRHKNRKKYSFFRIEQGPQDEADNAFLKNLEKSNNIVPDRDSDLYEMFEAWKIAGKSNHPTNADWCITIYVDPQRYGDELALERLMKFYEEKYPRCDLRLVELKIDDLEHRTPFLTKIAETDFRQRGYIADIEKNTYGKGAGGGLFVFVQRAQSAANHHLHKIAAFSSKVEKSVDKMSPTWMNFLSGLIGFKKIEIKQQLRKGKKSEISTKNVQVPLIMKGAMYIPIDNPADAKVIHMAYQSALRSAISNGAADIFRLTWAAQDDIRTQVRFEMRYADDIFPGASRSALLMWQTQVLAILRKAAWECVFVKGVDVTKAEDDIVNARNMMLAEFMKDGFDALDAKNLAFSKSEDVAFENLIIDFKGLGAEDVVFGPVYQKSKFVRGLEADEMFVAAIHGSSYSPPFDPDSDYDRRDPVYPLSDFATWIGDLKRHKHVILDPDIAYKILRLSGLRAESDDPYDCISWRPYEVFFTDRLPEPIWKVLAFVANDVIDRNQPIDVRYQWTRKPKESWSIQPELGCVLITGPLLDFPLSEVNHWNDKTTALTFPEMLY